MDPVLKTVLSFTIMYGLFGGLMLLGQPYLGRTQVAEAAGNFEALPRYIYIRVASAE